MLTYLLLFVEIVQTMSRVLLINYAGFPYCPSSLIPDNGLATLAGCLGRDGHEVRILDFATVGLIRRLYPEWISRQVRPIIRALFVEGTAPKWHQALRMGILAQLLSRRQKHVVRELADELLEVVSSFRPDLVGFKLWNGDGFSGSVRMADQLRKRFPELCIIAGGPQVDYFGRHILDYTDVFDYLTYGDGEETVVSLVRAVKTRAGVKDVPNLIYKRGGRVFRTPRKAVEGLDDVALPDYSLETYPALAGDEKIKIAVIDESRGCPYSCAFCIHPVKSGGVWRQKSPERVVDEMHEIMETIQTGLFIYAGSNTSAKTAMGISEEIIRRGMDVRYACFGHARGLNDAEFDTLKRSGCRAVFYGLESGCQEILDRSFNKRITVADAREILTACKRAGIFTIASVIFPAPFETDASRAETLRFLLDVAPDSVPVTAPGLIPGTPWHTQPERFGFEVDNSPDVWRYALTYKIKLLYPPSFWKRLPYTLNGRDSREFLAASSEFGADLERNGILTTVPHEMVIMAEAVGMDPREFRDLCRTTFFSGDVDAISGLVEGINRGAVALASRAHSVAEAEAVTGVTV